MTLTTNCCRKELKGGADSQYPAVFRFILTFECLKRFEKARKLETSLDSLYSRMFLGPVMLNDFSVVEQSYETSLQVFLCSDFKSD